MKNLKILVNLEFKSQIIAKSDLTIQGKQPPSCGLKDYALNVYSLVDSILYFVHEVNGSLGVEEIFDFRVVFSNSQIPKAIHMWYRDIYELIFVCFENGLVLSLNLGAGSASLSDEKPIGYNVEELIWSPDEEYAVVLVESKRLLLLDYDLNVVSDGLVDVCDSSVGEKELIAVGWGRKETQFHGSEGKQAALVKPTQLDDTSLNSHPSEAVKVSWRGDGRLFAVGYWCPQKNCRRIKIYNNEGILQCTSEDISGMEEPLFWRPQGNLITFPQRLPNKHVIGFMEKNGLKHGDFTLPDNLQVRDLSWNETSTILCLICENSESEGYELLLWTTGNYHWYLKQRFTLHGTYKRVWWDKCRSNRLNVVTSEGLRVLEWFFTVTTSQFSSLEEKAYVAVIDGREILLSCFKEAVVPPPMSNYQLTAPAAVNRLIFPPRGEDERLLCAILSDGSVAFFSDVTSPPQIYQVPGEVLPSVELSLAHWEWCSASRLVSCSQALDRSLLNIWELNQDTLVLRRQLEVPGRVISVTRSSSTPDTLISQTSDGQLYSLNLVTPESVEKGMFALSEVSTDLVIHSSGRLYSLSEWSRLYIDGAVVSLPSVAGNVRSFLLRDPYILATTSSHKLVILKYENNQCVEVSERKLERGSTLVSSSGNWVILQTPRGNLETIQPRALTLLSIRSLLDSRLYPAALSLLRKQRIDLNLLVDHNPTHFLRDAQLFIQEVDPQWITLLITELSEEDVTNTSYHLYYKSKKATDEWEGGQKVRAVCERLLDTMTDGDETSQKRFSLPILSALVKLGQMGRAIQRADSELTLQHLLFIVDVSQLYSQALGIYDLQAALKIAEKSQMDPKEYVPYLNSLREMEPNYMKYSIDKSLNRLESALVHLAKCSSVGHIEECMSFVKEKSLYPAALKLFKADTQRYRQLAELYGEQLFRERHYAEAGLMFSRAGSSELAIQAFIRAGDWRQALYMANKHNHSPERLTEIGEAVCSSLSSSHKWNEAAAVCLEWLSDPQRGLQLYLQGKFWAEALHIARKYEDKPQLMAAIRESLLEAVDAMIESISGSREKMEKYVARLKVVRIEKQNRPAFVYDDMSETASDASSTSSVQTRSFQSRSSKNTKKMSRKMWSLKEGNPREETALVATLSQLITQAEKYIGDVHYTCSMLLTFDEDSKAEALQNEMKEWLQVIEKSKRIIWPRDPEMNEAAIQDEKYKFPPEITIMPHWEFESLKSSK